MLLNGICVHEEARGELSIKTHLDNMNFRDKFIDTKECYLRSECRENADGQAIRSLLEREWEVFVIKRDESTGKLRGLTVCCEEALPPPPVRYA